MPASSPGKPAFAAGSRHVPPGLCTLRGSRRAARQSRQLHRHAGHCPGKPAFAALSRRVPPRLCSSRVYRRAKRTPGNRTSEHTTARGSRRLRLEVGVSRRGCAIPWSIGEQHATSGNHSREHATARAGRRLRHKTAVSRVYWSACFRENAIILLLIMILLSQYNNT